MKYDDFDIQIEPAGDKFRVRLLNAPTGQASSDFALPFTEIELANFLSRIGQVRRTTRRVDAPELQAAKEFGGKLFSAIFSGEMIAQLRGSMEQASDHEHGLRIRLRLTDVPALADLPWEFLYDANQNHFLTTSSETPVVRFLDLPQRIAPIRVMLPLRVLVVIASPRNLKRLDTEGEWERLQESLGDLVKAGRIVLERLPSATLDALRLRARGVAFHIFHFIGHGGFDEVAQDGVLQFEDESGMSYPVRGELLGMQLHDHRSLRLAVLNACEGARSSRQDPFSGVAQSLLQQRVPAVIAMQFEISDAAAKVFASEFYRAVAEGNAVDTAVCESRKALFREEFGQEWATPVLYMRSQEGQLFELQAAAVASAGVTLPVAGPPTPPTGVIATEVEEARLRAAKLAEEERRVESQREEQERAARAEQERIEREKAERDRIGAEKLAAERAAAAKAEAESAAAAKTERERLEREATEKAAAEKARLAHERAEAAQRAREAEARERRRLEQEEAERLARAGEEAKQEERAPIIAPTRSDLRLWFVAGGAFVLALVWLVYTYRSGQSRNRQSPSSVPAAAAAHPDASPANVEPGKDSIAPSPAAAEKTPVEKPKETTETSPPASPPAAVGPKPKAPAEKRVHQSSGAQAAKLVKKVNPAYPPLAMQSHTAGTVVLHAIIAKEGRVREVDVVSGHPLLVKSAVDAVKQWRYQPTYLNGVPVEVDTTVDIVFNLAGVAPSPAGGAASGSSPATGPSTSVAKSPCTFGKIDFSEQGTRLVGTVPYTYQGSDPLESVALRGIPLDKNKQRIAGLNYQQSTLKAASGTAYFSVDGQPSLKGRKEQQSIYLAVAIVSKQTNAVVCSEVVPYQRKW